MVRDDYRRVIVILKRDEVRQTFYMNDTLHSLYIGDSGDIRRVCVWIRGEKVSDTGLLTRMCIQNSPNAGSYSNNLLMFVDLPDFQN